MIRDQNITSILWIIGQCDHSLKCRKIWCIYNTTEQTWKTPPLPTHIRTYIRTYLSSLCTLPYGTILWHDTRKKLKARSTAPPGVSPPSRFRSVRRSPFSPQKHLSLAIDHTSPCNADEEKKPEIGVRIFAQRSIAVASSGGCGCFSISVDGYSR